VKTFMETPLAPKITWPEGKAFAFTIFDDTDFATVENVGPLYALLADCGFRTTKSCWVVRGDPAKGFGAGDTAEDPACLAWLLKLQEQGFEIGWHNATWHGLPRQEVQAALETFARHFQHYPITAANHSDAEGIYWGDARLTGFRAFLYNLLTRYHNSGKYHGHIEGDEYFWGDLCRKKIKYFRNFVFQDINTLNRCPFMPYHDTDRPYVNYWFASSNGARLREFNGCLAERRQDRLEAEGGACIMYTHFAMGFTERGKPAPQFERLMRRLAAKNGWFVPVATLLDYLLKIHGQHDITPLERRRLENRWLLEKLLVGTN
jgi:hypothetical protein